MIRESRAKIILFLVVLSVSAVSIIGNVSKVSIAQSLKEQKDAGREAKKEEKVLEKEARKEEKSLEKEARKSCDISYEKNGGKKKKCELSIYEQALPGINFDADEKMIDEMVVELQRDMGTSKSTVVR